MHRRFFFRLPFLLPLLTFAALTLSTHRGSTAVQDSQNNLRAPTEGTLLAVDDKGEPAGLCPLKHTDVKAEVSGFLSRVTVTQEFENPFGEKVEAVYAFPLPQAAAVDDMTMTVGERIVKGKIMRREEARAAYEEAKSRGQVASLLDQERPNIFTQSVANIAPGQDISIEVTLDAGVPLNDLASPTHEIEVVRTNINAEWEGVGVTEVFPKIVPDLFSAKPVILSGRYTKGGSGVIRLKGKMSGREFVREIPVELPETEARHDVLATLWARRKIGDLMGQDMQGLQAGKMDDELREAITQLGLDYRLMTQFTSFVAVDESFVARGGEGKTETSVPANAYSAEYGRSVGSTFPGGANAMVAIVASSAEMTSASVSRTIKSRVIPELPIGGRSHQSLLYLAPGTAPAAVGQSPGHSQDRLSVNGQRTTANSFIVDGVSANFGITPDEQDPGATASGTMPGLTVTGGTNGLVSTAATEEVNIRTYAYEPQHGRTPGGEIEITTRAGTNEFHGSLYEHFGNDALDAGDWFGNSRALGKPPHRMNDFGGTFGGPFKKDHTFFFGSYEGLRLRQPVVALTDVPSLAARLAAAPLVRPFLSAYPVPNGIERLDGFAELAQAFGNPARLDAASLRLDQSVTYKLMLYGRYDYAASSATERGAGGFSLNTLNARRSRLQTLTGSAAYTASPTVVLELRANYSRLAASSAYELDNFGGALTPTVNDSLAAFFSDGNRSARFDLDGRNAALFKGGEVASTQRQFQTIGAVTWVNGNHSWKFGADYRRIAPAIGLRPSERDVLFNGVEQAVTGVAARVGAFERATPRLPVFHNLSAYAQDEWRPTPALTLTYGVRWEVNPAPAAADARDPLAVNRVDDLAQLSFAQPGARLWKTTYGNFAPRVSAAYNHSGPVGDLVLRAGFGVFYDTGTEQAGRAFADSFPFVRARALFNRPFDAAVATPPNESGDAPLSVFDPELKLPYTLKWSFEVQQALGSAQAISAAYVGAAGRRLLLTESLFDRNADFPFIRLTTNGAASDYHAMQLQYNRRLSYGLQAFVSYTWSKSLDDYSRDSAARTLLRGETERQERGPSDFDVRHTLGGFLLYDVPSPFEGGLGQKLFRNWTVSSLFVARSARPVNVVYATPFGYGFYYLRPDLVAGVPVYILDPAAPGKRLINPASFAVPLDFRQGSLGRNSLRGFPLYQVDLALGRKFHFTDDVTLQFRTEVFNLFNRANLADPAGRDASLGTRLSPSDPLTPNLTFGQPASMYGRSLLGGTGSTFDFFYHSGGPRRIQFSLKFEF